MVFVRVDDERQRNRKKAKQIALFILHDGALGGCEPPYPEWIEHAIMERTGRPLHEIRAWSEMDFNVAVMRMMVEQLLSKQGEADREYERRIADATGKKGFD